MTQALRPSDGQAPDAEYSGACFEAFYITSFVTTLHAAYRFFVVADSMLGQAERFTLFAPIVHELFSGRELDAPMQCQLPIQV
jgi:hypothetical protein